MKLIQSINIKGKKREVNFTLLMHYVISENNLEVYLPSELDRGGAAMLSDGTRFAIDVLYAALLAGHKNEQLTSKSDVLFDLTKADVIHWASDIANKETLIKMGDLGLYGLFGKTKEELISFNKDIRGDKVVSKKKERHIKSIGGILSRFWSGIALWKVEK